MHAGVHPGTEKVAEYPIEETQRFHDDKHNLPGEMILLKLQSAVPEGITPVSLPQCDDKVAPTTIQLAGHVLTTTRMLNHNSKIIFIMRNSDSGWRCDSEVCVVSAEIRDSELCVVSMDTCDSELCVVSMEICDSELCVVSMDICDFELCVVSILPENVESKNLLCVDMEVIKCPKPSMLCFNDVYRKHSLCYKGKGKDAGQVRKQLLPHLQQIGRAHV